MCTCSTLPPARSVYFHICIHLDLSENSIYYPQQIHLSKNSSTANNNPCQVSKKIKKKYTNTYQPLKTQTFSTRKKPNPLPPTKPLNKQPKIHPDPAYPSRPSHPEQENLSYPIPDPSHSRHQSLKISVSAAKRCCAVS